MNSINGNLKSKRSLTVASDDSFPVLPLPGPEVNRMALKSHLSVGRHSRMVWLVAFMRNVTCIWTLALVLSVNDSALSQSSFAFRNYNPGVGLDAPMFDEGGNRLFGTNYLAILYGGSHRIVWTLRLICFRLVGQPFLPHSS